jgi:DNA-binding transcriptional ArsR family regulator
MNRATSQKKDLPDEIKELNTRIGELEKMVAALMKPLTEVRNTAQSYMKLAALLLDHGGLTPDLILPELKDAISKDIVRVLLERSDMNISQITELVRNKRGTASRRIVREKLVELETKNIIQKHKQGSRYVYSLTAEVIRKWTQLLGLSK